MPRNSLPPFLEKLAAITKTVDTNTAHWSEDGKSFVIKNAEKFELVLKQHFKGNAQTFIRQLHFYGFRKLDSQSGGGWSFAHPNFKKDCPQLLTEIRRKTRIDPTAENIASHGEVQALRTQVAHLQDVVEDLRTQLDSVITVLDEADLVGVDRRYDGKPLKITAGSKRPRTAMAPEFYKICENVKPVSANTKVTVSDLNPIMIADADLESASLGSISESDLVDVNEILKESVHSKTTTTAEHQMSKTKSKADSAAELLGHLLQISPDRWTENQNTKKAVQTIAKATQLDEQAVSKVLRYFADSSNSQETATTQTPAKNAQGSEIHPLSDDFTYKKLGQLTPLPAQRVGAN